MSTEAAAPSHSFRYKSGEVQRSIRHRAHVRGDQIREDPTALIADWYELSKKLSTEDQGT